MSSLSRSRKLVNSNLKKGLIITGIVTLILDLALVLLNLYFDNFSLGLVTGSGKNQLLSIFALNILPFTIYFLTNSMIMISENLYIAINYSLTRKNFYKSMIINSIIISLIFSIVQGMLFKAEPLILSVFEKNSRDNFILFNSWTDNLIVIIGILFVMIFTFISLLNLIVSLNNKFGFKIWLIFVGIILILILVNKGLNISFSPIMKSIESMMNISNRGYNLIAMGVVILISNLINYFTINSIKLEYDNRI
ncbi:MAG: hypothetical protein Q4P31_03175 [Andreesenia angusta]|nr:hypothetical protein [Andreesenia angusta]